ncbi:MAG: Rieske 2Fe-2S domain-containing protein [Actinobacteria bacterium]|nr:Rieske 2Fe-2S domain-containing protein [Actinomycetota bacterium]
MSFIRNFLRTTTSSWRSQSIALRIMRLWLGITWIYAGWNKATDAGFLTQGSTSFIGTQLNAYSTQSPLGTTVFNKLVEHSVQVGLFVMISEFAIGLATLLWVAPTLAAFGGFTMSVGLWLASSFHVKPYFLASDTAYAVLWISYLLLILGKRPKADISINRRGAVRVGIVGALAIGAVSLGKLFTSSNSPTSSSNGTSKNKVKKLADLPIGSTANFALASGEPAILFRTKTGVFAYSAICPHQGCTVGYSATNKVLACPCHGAEFDPFNSAKVIAGPAQSSLASIKVAIDGDWIVLA